jgi:hypothetical protein
MMQARVRPHHGLGVFIDDPHARELAAIYKDSNSAVGEPPEYRDRGTYSCIIFRTVSGGSQQLCRNNC